VLWPRKRDIGISYARMLLHDTMLKDDSYRTTAESPVCECGEDKESVHHILLHCRRFVEARSELELEDSVEDYIQMQSQNVLAWIKHPAVFIVSRKVNIVIKDALFQFISRSSMKL